MWNVVWPGLGVGMIPPSYVVKPQKRETLAGRKKLSIGCKLRTIHDCNRHLTKARHFTKHVGARLSPRQSGCLPTTTLAPTTQHATQY